MLAESTHQESEFELVQPFLFVMSGNLYQIEPYMETVGYESLFLIFELGWHCSLAIWYDNIFLLQQVSLGHELVGDVVLWWS
jgi:hypothetical protein